MKREKVMKVCCVSYLLEQNLKSQIVYEAEGSKLEAQDIRV